MLKTADPVIAPPRASKGEQTRAIIVAEALELAARAGLDGLTIGALAERLDMSKSGVFAHFGAREELQIAVLDEYHRRFEEAVFRPALSRKRGLPRLEAMVANWIEHVRVVEIPSGCLYISSAVEFDDQPGAVRDALVERVQIWQRALRRAIAQAIDCGHLRADTDAAQLVYEIHGILLALHHDARLMRSRGSTSRARHAVERLMTSYSRGA